MDDRSNARKVIAVSRSVIGPAEARLRTVRERKLGDYAHLPKVYRDVAQKLSSPVLMGPPICDELIALVQHLFMEEEAGAVRHLGLARSMSAAQVARCERRPVEEVEPILHVRPSGRLRLRQADTQLPGDGRVGGCRDREGAAEAGQQAGGPGRQTRGGIVRDG